MHLRHIAQSYRPRRIAPRTERELLLLSSEFIDFTRSSQQNLYSIMLKIASGKPQPRHELLVTCRFLVRSTPSG